jgi:tetratricopeptide (TPR) repeat protein
MSDQDKELNNLLLRANTVSHKNWLHAVNILEKASDEYPRERIIYLTLGDIYMKQRKFEQAISSYQKALTIEPDDEHLKFVIGNCYLSLSEYNMALFYYSQVTTSTPELTYNLALAYAYSNQHKESTESLYLLLDEVKDNINIYYFLIEEHLRISEYDEALLVLERIEKKFGVLRHQQILKGFIWTYRKVWIKAYTAFDNADKMQEIINPDHLHSFATASWQLGQLDRAIELLQRAITVNPYISVIHEDLIRICLQQRNYELAKDAIDRAKANLGKSNPILALLEDKVKRMIVEDIQADSQK